MAKERIAREFGYARALAGDPLYTAQIRRLHKAGLTDEQIVSDMDSGPSAERPGFETLWQQMRKGDTLFVAEISRLGRSLIQVVRTVEMLVQRGVAIVCLAEGTDGRTPAGHSALNLVAQLPTAERVLTLERTRMGQAIGRSRGRRPGRHKLGTDEQADQMLRLSREGIPVEEIPARLGISLKRSATYKYIREAEEREVLRVSDSR